MCSTLCRWFESWLRWKMLGWPDFGRDPKTRKNFVRWQINPLIVWSKRLKILSQRKMNGTLVRLLTYYYYLVKVEHRQKEGNVKWDVKCLLLYRTLVCSYWSSLLFYQHEYVASQTCVFIHHNNERKRNQELKQAELFHLDKFFLIQFISSGISAWKVFEF